MDAMDAGMPPPLELPSEPGAAPPSDTKDLFNGGGDGGIYSAGDDAWWAQVQINICGKSLGEGAVKALLGAMAATTILAVLFAVSSGGGGDAGSAGGGDVRGPGAVSPSVGAGAGGGAYQLRLFFELAAGTTMGDTFASGFAADIMASVPDCGTDVAVTAVTTETPSHVTVAVVGLSRDSVYACATQVTLQAADPSSKLLNGHTSNAINSAFPVTFTMSQQVAHGGGDCTAVACGAYQICAADATPQATLTTLYSPGSALTCCVCL